LNVQGIHQADQLEDDTFDPGIFGHTPIIMPLLFPVMEGIVIPWFSSLLSIMAAVGIRFMVHSGTTNKITEISNIPNIMYRSSCLQRRLIAIQMS
jgi:hypothetical protein